MSPPITSAASPTSPASITLGTQHQRRLREVWRSAGWPYQDLIEAELIAGGWLQRICDDGGRERVRVSDAGVQALAATLQRNRAARNEHEALVHRVAREMQRAGRLVWRGLALRAPLAGEDGSLRWVHVLPDVFSIRHTTKEDFLEPVVHEIKVRRADLLSDLRKPDKRAAYQALSGACWYVLAEGIGDADDVPPPCGVMVERAGELTVLRAAVARPLRLPFAQWMALARTGAEPGLDGDCQLPLA
jgi:hypothetical protein